MKTTTYLALSKVIPAPTKGRPTAGNIERETCKKNVNNLNAIRETLSLCGAGKVLTLELWRPGCQGQTGCSGIWPPRRCRDLATRREYLWANPVALGRATRDAVSHHGERHPSGIPLCLAWICCLVAVSENQRKAKLHSKTTAEGTQTEQASETNKNPKPRRTHSGTHERSRKQK